MTSQRSDFPLESLQFLFLMTLSLIPGNVTMKLSQSIVSDLRGEKAYSLLMLKNKNVILAHPDTAGNMTTMTDGVKTDHPDL